MGADSVDYTVTVEKATPTVNTNLTGNKLEVAYTGKAIEGYDKATPTADVVEEAAKPTGDITYTFYTDLGCSDENKVTNGGGKDGNIPIAVGTYYMKATYPGDKNYTSAEGTVDCGCRRPHRHLRWRDAFRHYRQVGYGQGQRSQL